MKNCPLCQVTLNRTLLERNLPAYACPNCHGIWVSSNEYLSWVAPEYVLSIEEIDIEAEFTVPYPIADNRGAIFCPDCGRFLRRYQIWPNLAFHLDRCSHCNGCWFDENEWQTLQAQNLHNKINIFFTDLWQQKLRGEEMKSRFEKMYLEKFGADDYERIRDIRAWLQEHENGGGLLAYLTDRDPYRG